MATPSFQHLTTETLDAWLAADASLTLVDIRDPMSFANGRIPGSRHLDSDSVPALLEAAPRAQPMVVICYHGRSSQQAADWLAGQGFAEVFSLDGGFTEWQHRFPGRVER